MMPEESSQLKVPGPNKTLLAKRLLNAPIEMAFKAWTDPALLAAWWGPNGFTNTFQVFEPIPGGKWSFVMQGPDGKKYQNACQFIRIDPPFFLAFDHLSDHKFQVQSTFIPEPEGRCTVEFRMIFPSADEVNEMKEFISEKNEENLDRLEAVLEKLRRL